MSAVWQTQYRLLRENLEQCADRFGDGAPGGSALGDEEMVRLLAGTLMVLARHEVNRRRQCRHCGCSRWGLFRRRPQCTVFRAFSFTMGQTLDVVWWQLFAHLGRERSLTTVRAWLTTREAATRPSKNPGRTPEK